jgi:hypothetical protein
MRNQVGRYDPLIYDFMRACGAPRLYYHTYMRELGLRGSRAKPIRPYSQPAKPLTAYEWVTPKIVGVSLHYLSSPPSLSRAEVMVRRALDNVDKRRADASASRRSIAGAERTLLHAQARLWAAIVAATPEDDPRKVVRGRAPSELVIEARLARHSRAKLRSQDITRSKLRTRKRDEAEREYATLRAAIPAAQANLERYRVAYKRAVLEAEAVRVERRATSPTAKLPKGQIALVRAAKAEFDHARRHVERLHRDRLRARAKLARLTV